MLVTVKSSLYIPDFLPLDYWSIKYQVSTEALLRYKDALINHIQTVNVYGNKFGVSQNQLNIHDKSKWTRREFPFYANRFHGDKNHNREFVSALNHHYANNMHHPEYWRYANGTAHVMPRPYILEMIADWHAASLQYMGSDDIQHWLDNKLDKTLFNPESLDLLGRELREIGYDLRS